MEQACTEIVRIFDFTKTYEMLGVEDMTYIDLEKTFGEALSLFSGLINLKVVNDCHGLTVLADSLLEGLLQLFYNLIDNSLKHGLRADCGSMLVHGNPNHGRKQQTKTPTNNSTWTGSLQINHKSLASTTRKDDLKEI
jgi:hypothetical protein